MARCPPCIHEAAQRRRVAVSVESGRMAAGSRSCGVAGRSQALQGLAPPRIPPLGTPPLFPRRRMIAVSRRRAQPDVLVANCAARSVTTGRDPLSRSRAGPSGLLALARGAEAGPRDAPCSRVSCISTLSSCEIDAHAMPATGSGRIRGLLLGLRVERRRSTRSVRCSPWPGRERSVCRANCPPAGGFSSDGRLDVLGGEVVLEDVPGARIHLRRNIDAGSVRHVRGSRRAAGGL